ncbi:MAG: Valine--tRNA ligase [Alphaproteobacteria bacterium MarineAlpha5_Bin12]|nr:MAG: Valine--tRNA ligase [Alphaproteobacteria bacterium MarineAlpha5_Bin12]|tara:strand:+ start:3284 stop:5917 length:2634 start_codon:yes stop_codon:yes gene_type:complete
MKIEKNFDFLKFESKIYKSWENKNYFKPKKSKDPYCIMMPPPNVTGSLHMGHALTFTIQDILIRYNRMKGKEVLWQAGTDHAGIATQMVVENQLLKKNIKRKDIGRENFIKEVWKWKKKSGNTINNQLKRLGSSADWSRERFTMDNVLSQAVKKAFIDLYNAKLIYKDKRLVNWDPKLLTAISDLEVNQIEQEGSLWHIKYPIDDKNFLIIATTRPETMLGDTAVAVNPNDKRYKKLIGKSCKLPFTDRKIPIIADNYADPEKGSGAVKITPAHDFNDFEIGKKHNLKFINIFTEEAKINSSCPKEFVGMDRYDARKKILELLEKMNLLFKEEKQLMVVPYGDRSGVVIEPWLTNQWFCDAKFLSKDPIKAVNLGKTKFVPEQWKKTFFNWMRNIQPWCISRQLWWGHQIPAWYGPDNKIFVANNLNEANKMAKKCYKKQVKIKQDDDVLDTWFSSALWTFSTLDWPKKTYELNKFYPGNVLVTGFDIIFFWVARMMMMGSYFMKKTPFKDVYIHPLIRDEKGQKMSKSKGNIIDPLELLDKYGADTLRFTLTALLNPGRDVKLSEARVKGYRSFINKIWNASNYLLINKCYYNKNFKFNKIKSPLNQWLINELFETKTTIDEYMKKYLFHEVANELYQFIWHQYCDWYVELTKSTFNNKNEYFEETKETAMWTFVEILKIIHPIMPFVSEHLWSKIFENRNMLINENLKNYKKVSKFNDSQINIHHLIMIITKIRNLRSELNIPYKKLISIDISNKNKKTLKFLKLYISEFEHLLKTDKINFYISNKIVPNSAYLIIENTTICVYLKDIIDTNEESKKILKKKEKLITEHREIKSKLNNSNFIQKAPENIIEQFKNQEKSIKSSIEKLDQIIDSIK